MDTWESLEMVEEVHRSVEHFDICDVDDDTSGKFNMASEFDDCDAGVSFDIIDGYSVLSSGWWCFFWSGFNFLFSIIMGLLGVFSRIMIMISRLVGFLAVVIVKAVVPLVRTIRFAVGFGRSIGGRANGIKTREESLLCK